MTRFKEMTPYDLTKGRINIDINELLILDQFSVMRKVLLESAGLVRIELAPRVDESFKESEKSKDYVKRIAVEKAIQLLLVIVS